MEIQVGRCYKLTGSQGGGRTTHHNCYGHTVYLLGKGRNKRGKRTYRVIDSETLVEKNVVGARLVPVNDGINEHEAEFLSPSMVAPETVEDVVMGRSVAGDIERVLSEMKPMYKFVLERRFGILDGHLWTLQEIAEASGRTRECVRQLEAYALRTLRNTDNRSKLENHS